MSNLIREYEILVIVKPNLGDDKYKKLEADFQSWITSFDGEITLYNSLGTRELAETFQKYDQGYYIQCQFKGNNKTLESLQEKMAVNENFLRDLVVRLDSIQSKKSDAKKDTVEA